LSDPPRKPIRLALTTPGEPKSQLETRATLERPLSSESQMGAIELTKDSAKFLPSRGWQ
jgi:hypothetical protein